MQTVRIENGAGGLVAYLECELDHHSAKGIRQSIDARLKSLDSGALTLDFSGVSFMDSSGIGLILGRLEKCRARGISLIVKGHTGLIARLISMSGIRRLDGIKVE